MIKDHKSESFILGADVVGVWVVGSSVVGGKVSFDVGFIVVGALVGCAFVQIIATE